MLTEMVGRVVAGERRRITRLLAGALTPAIVARLDAVLQAAEGMYASSALKHEPKDFSYGELRQEVERRASRPRSTASACSSAAVSSATAPISRR